MSKPLLSFMSLSFSCNSWLGKIDRFRNAVFRYSFRDMLALPYKCKVLKIIIKEFKLADDIIGRMEVSIHISHLNKWDDGV